MIAGVTTTTTLKPAGRVTTSAPVVSVTSRVPSAALAAIETFTVALVGLCTVTVFTVIPAPKLAIVLPGTKWVT